MKFNIADYKDKKVAIHCKTYDEAMEFCKLTNRENEVDWWFDYEENTCYDINLDEYTDIKFYLSHNYTILEWEFLNGKEFTKSDLKTGDIVLRRNGDTEIVILEQQSFIAKTGYNLLSSVNEDLTSTCSSNWDIIAVRRPVLIGDCTFSAFDANRGILIYEREEVEMTIEEICKALGKKVRIKK